MMTVELPNFQFVSSVILPHLQLSANLRPCLRICFSTTCCGKNLENFLYNVFRSLPSLDLTAKVAAPTNANRLAVLPLPAAPTPA